MKYLIRQRSSHRSAVRPFFARLTRGCARFTRLPLAILPARLRRARHSLTLATFPARLRVQNATRLKTEASADLDLPGIER